MTPIVATQGFEVTSHANPPAYMHPSISARIASTPIAVPAGWEAILGAGHGRTVHGMTRCDFTVDSRSSASTSDAAAAGMMTRGARALRNDEDAVEALESALDALHKNQVRACNTRRWRSRDHARHLAVWWHASPMMQI
jgi:hypothetical protein